MYKDAGRVEGNQQGIMKYPRANAEKPLSTIGLKGQRDGTSAQLEQQMKEREGQ